MKNKNIIDNRNFLSRMNTRRISETQKIILSLIPIDEYKMIVGRKKITNRGSLRFS